MRRVELAAAVALCVALAFHVVDKVASGRLPEMLWSCNVTSVMLAAAVVLDRPRIAAVGWLTFASVGLLAWLIDLSVGAETTPASVAVHLMTPAVGALYIARVRLWPRTVPVAAALQGALFLLSLWFTEPELNINMAHRVWAPIAPWMPSIWLYHAVNFACFGLLLAAGFAICRRLGLVESSS